MCIPKPFPLKLNHVPIPTQPRSNPNSTTFQPQLHNVAAPTQPHANRDTYTRPKGNTTRMSCTIRSVRKEHVCTLSELVSIESARATCMSCTLMSACTERVRSVYAAVLVSSDGRVSTAARAWLALSIGAASSLR